MMESPYANHLGLGDMANEPVSPRASAQPFMAMDFEDKISQGDCGHLPPSDMDIPIRLCLPQPLYSMKRKSSCGNEPAKRHQCQPSSMGKSHCQSDPNHSEESYGFRETKYQAPTKNCGWQIDVVNQEQALPDYRLHSCHLPTPQWSGLPQIVRPQLHASPSFTIDDSNPSTQMLLPASSTGLLGPGQGEMYNHHPQLASNPITCSLQDLELPAHSLEDQTHFPQETYQMHPPPATTQDVIRNGLEWGYYDGHQSDESNFKMMSETPFDTSKTASLTKRSSSSSNYSDDETLAIMESLPYMEAEPEKRHDDYSVAESDEEDMALLADALSAEIAQPIPPTSVINEMERPSSTDVFDPNLQRSSPTSNEHGKSDGKRNPSDEEELLDYDVEWDNVLECLPSLPRDPSLPKRPDIVHQEKETSTNAELQPYNTNLHATSSSHGGKPQPFSRPPFPNPVRNKSPVAGVSNSHVLRTCFRIGQMVNESSRCLKAGVEPTFELYARVTYSSRELLSRVQHFQFMDLFKEQLPYPTGMLSGWRTGSLLDRESAVFLEASDGGSDGAEAMVRMCRCIGKLRPDNKMQMGWIVVVLRIQEVGWDEIGGIKRTVCRE